MRHRVWLLRQVRYTSPFMRLRDGTPRQKAMFAALVATYVLGVVLIWWHAATLVGRPHTGLFWAGHTLSFAPAEVRKAGIEWGSKALAFNGVRLADATSAEVLALERRDLGAINQVTVRQPNGKVVKATVPVMVYTWRHALESFGITGGLLAGAFLVALGTFALRPYESSSWALLVAIHLAATAGTTMGLGALGTPVMFKAYFGLVVCLLLMSGFHLGLGFPTPHPLLRRHPQVLYGIYGLGLLYFIVVAVVAVPPHRLGIWPRIFGVAFFTHLAGLLFLAGRCVLLAVRSGERLVRQRARFMLVVACAALLHRVFEIAVLVFGFPVGQRDLLFGYAALISSGIAVVYLTLRYDLVSARIAVRRTVAYASGGAVVVGLVGLGAYVSPFLAAAVLLPVFVVLPRFNARLNGWLYPRRAAFPELRRTVGDELLACTTREDVLHVLAGAPPRVCDTDSGAAFLLPGATDQTEHISGSGESDVSNVHDLAEEPLVQTLVAGRETIKRESIGVDPRFAKISQEARACMDRLNASVLLPIERDGKVIGGLAVGPHVSDDVFDPAELDLLRELAHQAVQALDVAALRERSSNPGGTTEQMASPVTEQVRLPSVAHGRFVAERLLGEGGFKRVYLARDTRLQRDVALAMIRPERLSEAGRTRIEREAQAMARLGAQPHIVTVYDIGEETGELYIVNEYMPGGDLAERLEAGALPVNDAVRIATELCNALEAAHGEGIVHRDLKPGNVWFTSTHSAKLGDFGLALAEDESRITEEGAVVGTVAYMSPEQARGQTPVPQSDLYALGVVLYEMLTGRLPFTGSPAVMLDQHKHATPAPPAQHNENLPPDLDALVLQLLAKDPADRPSSARAVRGVLESISA